MDDIPDFLLRDALFQILFIEFVHILVKTTQGMDISHIFNHDRIMGKQDKLGCLQESLWRIFRYHSAVPPPGQHICEP